MGMWSISKQIPKPENSLAWFVSLAILVLASSAVYASGPPENCLASFLKIVQEESYGKLLTVRPIPPNWIDHGNLKIPDFFGTKDQVFLGMNDNGHYYLIAGKDRYDAGVLKVPAVEHDATGAKADAGVLVKFENLPDPIVQKVIENINRQPQPISFNCVNGVCMELHRSGVQFNGSDGKALAADELPVHLEEGFVRLIRDGLTLPDGTPLKFQIYLNSRRPLRLYSRAFRVMDKGWVMDVKKAYEEDPEGMKLLGADFVKNNHDLIEPSTHKKLMTLIQNGIPEAVIVVDDSNPAKKP